MSASKGIEPAAVLPRTAWQGVLAETTIEVFSLMVGVTVVPALDATRVPIQVTAIVGIAGAIRANFILQCSTVSTIRLASQMLGISLDAPDSQKAALDALGEICNIVAGFFKAKVGLGDACKLSVPVIISGQDYQFCSRTTYERLELPLTYEGETLWASLEIAQ
jgi:CheY-specific phosphatase CheX